MIRKILDLITGETSQSNKELEALKCDTNHNWHIGVDPDNDGKYLVFCKVGGIYIKAIGNFKYLWDGEGPVPNWTIDHFLDQISIDGNARILAWAVLSSDVDSGTDKVKDAIDQIIKFGNIAYDSSTMLIWIGVLNDPVSGDHVPNIFMVASKLGIVEKLEKIVTTFEFCKSASDISSIDIKRLCNDFDDSMALMREVFMRLTEKMNPKTFDYAWEEAKKLHPGYSSYRDMIGYIRRRNDDR